MQPVEREKIELLPKGVAKKPMTVALLGVGADSSNSSPTPPVYQSGQFEYIPIPESEGPEGTTETSTFGNTPLRHQDEFMADYLDYIQPSEEEKVKGEKMREWPFHHDPNFEALTYGECESRPAYLKVLRQLQQDDLIAFYTGLQSENTRFKHRYVIGHFTVDLIVDFENLERVGKSVRFSQLSRQEQNDLIDTHKDNAHAKRFKATGQLKHGDGLIIVRGQEPGGLLDRAYRISYHSGGGHFYLKEELADTFSPTTGDGDCYLGGFKQAHILDISPNKFIDIVTR